MERKKITFDSFIRGSIGCVLVVGILMLVERLSGVLLPFFIAWLIAYMVYPLVKFFQYKLRLKSRIISIFCSLFLITVIGVTLFYLLVPPMISEIGRMNDLLVTYLTNGAGNNVPKSLSEFIHENIDLQALNRVLSEENILAAIKDTVPRVWTLLAESLNILFSILASFIILLYVIFILLDYEAIAEGWLHLLPNKYRTFASNLVHDVQDGMNRYFRGQALVAFCVGILFSIGFLIIDFPMAIALGLFIGALNMVPYLQIIGFLPHHSIGNPQSCRHRTEFLDYHCMRISCLCNRTNHTGYLPCPQNHGKDYRTESCHHPFISFHLGFINGNARYDHRLTTNNFNALLLPTLYYQQRKDKI